MIVEHGAVLLRGFDVQGAGEFETLCRTGTPDLLDYTGGGSPRSLVSGKVYTSTEFPAHLEVYLHNELSYSEEWPARLSATVVNWRPGCRRFAGTMRGCFMRCGR